MMKTRTCVTCNQQFQVNDGEDWKLQCYDCYKEFRIFSKVLKPGDTHRLHRMGFKSGLYIAHPSVTVEEVQEFIEKMKYPHGWGVREWKPEQWDRFKIFINDENFD